MNKSIAIFIAALIVLTAVLPLGCASHKDEVPSVSPAAENTEAASAEPTSAEPAKQTCIVHIFKFISDGLTDPYPQFDYETKEIRDFDESKAGTEKTVEFLGKQYRLVYKETITSVLDDLTCDKYSADGSENDYAILLPDDSVYALCLYYDHDPIFDLDISETDDPELVRTEVEEALKTEIDFSRFTCSKVTRTLIEEDGTGRGNFDFSWYNMKGKYQTKDKIEIHVEPDGKITIIKPFFRGFIELNAPDDVSIENYSEDIDAALRGCYGDNYIRHEIQNTRWTQVDGKPGLFVQVGAFYRMPGSEYECADFVEMFIEILP